MTEILPGITQLKVPIPNNPLGHTNVYLLRSEDGYVLIDAGFNSDEAFVALRDQVAEAGADLADISRLIITHAHGDHIGLAGKVRQASGAKIALHRLEKPQLPPAGRDREAMIKQSEEWMRVAGIPHEEPPAGRSMREMMHRFEPPPSPDITLDDNQMVSVDGLELKVIWTPGHTAGLICLYDAGRKVLFSADHVLPVTTPNIGLRMGHGHNGQSESNPLGDYIKSLDKVRDLDVDTVLPSHEQVFHNLQERVDQILEHHRHRNEEVLATMKSGPKTGYQVAEGITWIPESGGVDFHKLAHWDQRMAVSETLSHLTALRDMGAIERYARDGVVYYQLTGK